MGWEARERIEDRPKKKRDNVKVKLLNYYTPAFMPKGI